MRPPELLYRWPFPAGVQPKAPQDQGLFECPHCGTYSHHELPDPPVGIMILWLFRERGRFYRITFFMQL